MKNRSLRPYTRRQVLRGIGTAGLTAPLWPMLESRAALSGPRPIRFLLVWQPNGLVRDQWLLPDNTFGAILKPLEPVKSSVVILKNLNNRKSGGGADPHIGFGAGSTTGRGITEPYDGSEGAGESIDHHLSRTIGKDRPRKLLGMRTGKNAVEKGHLTYSAARAPVPYEVSVDQLFATMFAGVAPVVTGGGGGGTGGAAAAVDSAAAARLRARKLSVLDAVANDLTLVQSRLGSRDRAKLDAHLTTIRELEMTLKAATSPTAPAMTPAAPAPAPVTGMGGCHAPDIKEDAGPASGFRRFMNLTISAFACDYTRVATFQWGGPGAHLAWKIPGAFPTSTVPMPGQTQVEKVGAWTHHNLDHGDINGGAGYTGEVMGQMRVAIMTYYMTQLAWLIERLKATPEGGGTMLDNTVLVWMNESSSNGHNGSGTPFLIAGAANKWQSGRVVDVAGASQNDAWMSVAHLLGVELNQFGDPTWGKGPIASLVG